MTSRKYEINIVKKLKFIKYDKKKLTFLNILLFIMIVLYISINL